jgi:hypothetical protein
LGRAYVNLHYVPLKVPHNRPDYAFVFVRRRDDGWTQVGSLGYLRYFSRSYILI